MKVAPRLAAWWRKHGDAVDIVDIERMMQPQHIYIVGGAVTASGPRVRLTVGPAAGDRYVDAQLDDYHQDGRMRWRPPVRLSVRARFSHGVEKLRGTAGFGFWNDPLGMTGSRRLRLPQATWFFFGGADTDIPLRKGVRGNGWKATMVDASHPLVPVLLPVALPAAWLMRSAWWYRRLWPRVEQYLGVYEAELHAEMDAWHDYVLEWRQDHVTYAVDGQTVLITNRSPRGPLGLVIWLDNQFMIATPQGRFDQGVVKVDEQWMELAALDVTALA